MKKFTKVCLIIAAVLFVSGIAFCIAGAVCGVDYEKLRELSGYGKKVETLVVTDDSSGFEFEEDYSGIRELELDISVASVYIVISADDRFHVSGVDLSSSFQCRQEGDTLRIESKRKKTGIGNMREEITIEVPEGADFEEIELKVGVGSVEADSLHCGELSIDCDMGSVLVSGSVSGDCEIDCGIGEVALNLENEESDFDYDVECGIGEVILGEHSYSGLARAKEISNGADKAMDIDCGIGSVIVTFDNE